MKILENFANPIKGHMNSIVGETGSVGFSNNSTMAQDPLTVVTREPLIIDIDIFTNKEIENQASLDDSKIDKDSL